MDLNALGKVVFLMGVALVTLGAFLVIASRIPVLKQLGHLPGDIHLEGSNFSCFFPVVSMILLSILLSIGLNIIIRLLNC